jgi:hypothetical protein
MKDVFARCFKKTAVQVCTVNIMHLSSCNVMYSHVVLLIPVSRESNSHSWALTDKSVTSGTILTMMPECRCQTKSCKLTEN